ncbi:MAG TPA: DUF2267 domain-containing protein [Leptolyngbyaceae cyanobacterium]
MKSSEFINTVQAMAGIDSKQEATQAIQATFETLAERLVGNEADQLAAQVPDELGQWLRGHRDEPGQHFSLQEFYHRVSDREGVDPTQATIHSRAVISVLGSAVTSGEFEDVKLNLPHDYQDLFSPGAF